MIRISLYITTKQKAALKARSKRTGMKEAELVRRAIDELIAKYK